MSALMAVDEALHRPPADVLLLAPALRQSQELFRKVQGIIGALGDLVAPMEQESATSLELVTGSRIICLPGSTVSTVRGYCDVRLIVVDEAARVSDDLYASVRPMLAVSGGRLVVLSSPYRMLGFFYREYTAGSPDWHRVKTTADQCPRISREFGGPSSPPGARRRPWYSTARA